ncbi:MAG: malonyl-ACP O-methyltransferase BioC [Xanthomonadales bacterium]|nr:malonyl-ACP O-methyltransferase BioC [Xanthomonadales bacterium]
MIGAFDRTLLRRRFGSAAPGYAAVAKLQQEAESRLLEQVEAIASTPSVVLDVGCGPGRATAALARRWRDARVIGVDLALPMLRLARRARGWLRRQPVVCADANRLPLPDASVDLLFSSLCLQWLGDPQAALAEFARVLRPGGTLLASTFGPGTLAELRQAWAAADDRGHVSEFVPMAALGDALLAQGFGDPVLDRDVFALSYPDLDGLLRELRAIGANNARSDRPRGLAGKHGWRRMRAAYAGLVDHEGRWPASYEVIYLRALAPAPGRPRRSDGTEIATVPISAIRRRPRP